MEQHWPHYKVQRLNTAKDGLSLIEILLKWEQLT
jgi:hypothetical protein